MNRPARHLDIKNNAILPSLLLSSFKLGDSVKIEKEEKST